MILLSSLRWINQRVLENPNELKLFACTIQCRKKISLTAKNIKIASRLRGEILNRIREKAFHYGNYFPNSKRAKQFDRHAQIVTIGTLLEDYRKEMECSTEKSTYVGYRKAIYYLMPDFKDIKIQDLKASMIRAWIQQRPVSLKTLRNYLIPFRAIVERALADDLIEKNPFDKIFPKRLVSVENAHTKHEVDPFDEEEVFAILNAATGQLKNLYQFAFFSGLRIEELVALRWDDIDWHHKEIHVQRSMVLDIEKEPKNRCKTHSSKRKVMLLPPAYQALMNQREHTYLLGEFIFHNPNTNQSWYSYKAYYRCWSNTVKAARVVDFIGKKTTS